MNTTGSIIKMTPKVPLIMWFKNKVIITKAMMVREILSKFPIFFLMSILTYSLVKQHCKDCPLKISSQPLLLHKDNFIASEL